MSLEVLCWIMRGGGRGRKEKENLVTSEVFILLSSSDFWSYRWHICAHLPQWWSLLYKFILCQKRLLQTVRVVLSPGGDLVLAAAIRPQQTCHGIGYPGDERRSRLSKEFLPVTAWLRGHQQRVIFICFLCGKLAKWQPLCWYCSPPAALSGTVVCRDFTQVHGHGRVFPLLREELLLLFPGAAG